MITEKNFKTIISIVLIVGLFILAALIIQPIITPIILGILLAYIFNPIYLWIKTKTKNENLSAFLICFGLLIIILGPIILVLNSLVKQIIDIYLALQTVSIGEVINNIWPSFLSSEIPSSLSSSFDNFISGIIASTLRIFTDFILNLPANLLKFFVLMFVFFFGLRDGRKLIDYLKTLSPLSKETEEHFFKHFKDVTYSVLMGQIAIGIIQGIIAGIGYFVFGVPNALLLTLLTMLVGIIPLIGPWLVWVPVDLYLFSIGRTGAGLGLLIYGLVIISWLDAFIRPIIVSKRTKMNSAIVIIGMIGGLFVFGILGLIIGPLVLAYILLIMELYRKSRVQKNLFFKEK